MGEEKNTSVEKDPPDATKHFKHDLLSTLVRSSLSRYFTR